MNANITLIKKLRGTATMANQKINGGASPYPKHVGPAAICSFPDGADGAPLKTLVFSIEPNQSGSGDPSPQNIRPISGWTQVDGKQSGADMSDYTPITIALGQTVYGGTVDALAGSGESTMAEVDLGSLSWTYRSDIAAGLFSANLPGYKYTLDVQAICSNYKYVGTVAGASFAGGKDNASFCLYVAQGQSSRVIYVKDTAYTSKSAFETAMSGVKVVYELASPTTLSLTPVSVNSLLGQNNVWCNTGDTELDYYPAQSSVVAVWDRTRHMYVSIPLSAIRYDTYQINPQQAIDLDSYRSETGTLIRNVVGSKCKIEFNTPMMDDSQWSEVWSILSAGFNNTNEKKLKLKYYDTQSGSYKYGYFYVPDVQTPIRSIDEPNGIINYNEIRIAFIEY